MTKTLQLTINGGWQQFIKPLRERLPFKTYGNLSGRPGPADTFGQLPEFFRASAARADYVVYSYATPIAWHEPGMTLWLSPGIRYSVTTTKAQGRIFTALSQLPADA